MATLRQSTSFGPGIYRGRHFDRAKLEAFVQGTNKAIAAGIPVPLVRRHVPIDASDTATMQFSKEEGAGWVTAVGLDGGGNLWWEAKDVPEADAAAVERGEVRYSSPEFRPKYASEKAGVYSGPIIRHIAFSFKPGNPHQGKIERVDSLALDESETAWQFDESERTEQFGEGVMDESLWEKAKKEVSRDKYKDDDSYYAVVSTVYKNMGGRYKSKDDASQHDEDVTPSDNAKSRADSEAPLDDKGDSLKNNPDAPPKATDRSKLSAVIAGLAQKNIVLPSDFDFTADGAIDILVAAINSAISAENRAKAEQEPADPDDEPVTDAAMPFDEQYGDSHQLLKTHGYHLIDDTGRRRIYGHKKLGHSVDLYPGGSWAHYANKPGKRGTAHEGKGYENLQSHLKSLHGTSQHDEQPTSLNGVSVMFTPEEIAAAPESLRAKMQAQNDSLKTAEEKAAQFDEERRTTLNNAARDKAIADVTAAKIPAGLRTKLLAGYKPVKEGEEAPIQFDEGEEQPLYTASQVAAMVAESLPPNMQFDEAKTKEVEAPKIRKVIGHDAKGNPVYGPESSEQFFEKEGDGETPSGHVSDEEAERLVAANPVFAAHNRTTRRSTLAQDVADETRRNPSRMVE